MKLKIALLFVFSTTFLMAQNTISGKVNDRHGTPLAGAQILLLDTEINTQTDTDGFYQIENLKMAITFLKLLWMVIFQKSIPLI